MASQQLPDNSHDSARGLHPFSTPGFSEVIIAKISSAIDISAIKVLRSKACGHVVRSRFRNQPISATGGQQCRENLSAKDVL
jgi:hypothetical protein